MPELKPARKFVLNALPRNNGFLGQFAAPGWVPDVVKERGQPIVFENRDHALAAAGEVLCQTLNSGPQLRDKMGPYDRMTPLEFANELAELDMTLTYFAWLWGTRETRAQKWITGEDGIPHGARVFLALLALPGAIELADEITSKVTGQRRPPDVRHHDDE